MRISFTIILLSLLSYCATAQTVPCENPIQGAACHPGGDQPEDGSGSLGITYQNTDCGLNYAQASLMTTTRYTSNPGPGFPATLTITGIPCGANGSNIQQAYIWWGASNSSADPNFTFNGNPMVGTLIGTGPHKCWGLGGTEHYRGDVTAQVAAGNGNYTFSSPIGNGVDGATLMIIYKDPAATYEGTIQINDGDITNNSGGPETQTMNGLNVCANSTYGEAFVVCGDMQDNVAPPTHTATLNGVGTVFPNEFWNFDMATTTFNAGQTTSGFGLNPTGGGDCYSWILMGIYYQTTSCAVCVPTVAPLPLNMVHTDENCGQCDGTATANAGPGGTQPYTYNWTGPGGPYVGNPINNLCAGTYIVTVTDASGCFQSIDSVIVASVGGGPAPVITPAGPFCTGDLPLNLTVTVPGGTWSGTGITNPATGTFSPGNAGVGVHQIIYNTGGACPQEDTINIVVNSIADATITPAGPFCPNDPQVNLTAVSPGGTWSGTGIINAANGTFSPTTAGPGTYTITYMIGGSCGDTSTINITVDPFFDATITPVGSYCLLDPPFNLSAFDPGGSWSGPGITNAAAGTFDPQTAGVGNHTITYGIPGNCGDTQTTNIVVSAALNATITPAGPFCESDPSAQLTAVDPGGVWSGTGITNTATGTFDPNTAGPGNHNITYGISGSCGDTNTIVIIVIPDADATITPVATLCELDPAFNMTAVDPNGTWSGTGITNAAAGTFDPGIAGVGVHTITYTIPGACGDMQTTNVTVTAQDVVTINPAGPYCIDNAPVQLSAAMVGGTWSGNGITNAAGGMFDPSIAGAGTHTITYTTNGPCGNTDTEDIIVHPLPVIDFSVDTASLCLVPELPFEFSTDTSGGAYGSILWNFGDGSGGSSETISHTYNAAGVYDITLTMTSSAALGSCTNSLTKYGFVQVFQNPTADFTMNPNPTNMLTPEVDFTDQSYTNIQSWLWNIGGLDIITLQNHTYIFPEDTGNYLVTLTVTDANGCVGSTQDNLIVRGEYGIYVPNAFTPDFDGMNDGFFPNGFGISDFGYSFMIFDRWGEMIFESYTVKEPWYGVYKNKLVPNGVYVWKLHFRDINGKEHDKYGHVTIVK